MAQLKEKAKYGLITLAISVIFFAISSIVDTSIPIDIFGSAGEIRIFFVIGGIFLIPTYFLLTVPSNNVGQRRRRTLDIFE